ncbi:MAG: transposase family protein [Solirubrobacteraceae bacterium]
MTTDDTPARERWARLRFSVVAPLLAAPPLRGDLKSEIQRLAEKTWRHPTTGEPIGFGFSTIERWYYQTLVEQKDPIGRLARKLREDAGTQPSLGQRLRDAIRSQYHSHKRWSYQLHYDNLVALAKEQKELLPVPSYATVRRFMQHNGLVRVRRIPKRGTPGAELAAARLESREVRSYEATYVGELWHLDFHEASRPVLTKEGKWEKPQLLGLLDDCSRLACHVQWYLNETAENAAHGTAQGIQKRGLPRGLMTDRGAAETAAEFVSGLAAFGLDHFPTLPYSPYQNAKQESFWTLIEGRLLPMLEGVKELTLELLNEATFALVELEYHREVHSEIGTTPLRRFLDEKSVLRPSPTTDELRRAFRVRSRRKQRRSDGTVAVEARRYEVPSRFRHMIDVWVSYARWDLSSIDMIDPITKNVVATLLPLDKRKNADGLRRSLEHEPVEDKPPPPSGIAPLLRQLMDEWKRTGLPPAYLPKDDAGSTEPGVEVES